MTLKKSLSSKAAFLICLLLLSLSCCSSPITKPVTKPVRLDDFKEGVSFNERIRLKVKDIVVGEKSVKDLFRNIDQKEPSQWEYYSGKESKISLIIKSPKHIEELRVILAAQHTDRLKVILQDDQATILRRIFPGRFNNIIEIPIEQTPCDEITRIIYVNINSIIKEQIEKVGETDKHVDLDQVFDMLLHDKIEPYIAQLDEVKKEDTCFKTFQLLKWLKGDDIPGFDLGEYEFNEGLRGLLQPAIDALGDIRSGSARYSLNVKIVGYTDPVPVKINSKDLRADRTGIDDWSKIETPLDVKYKGCSNDKLDGKSPIYINLKASDGKQIKQKINNNCELGAVRAYVAMIYLVTKLGQDGIEYGYATGGIFPSSGDNDKKEDPKKRKVNIEFILKTARRDK